MERNFVYILTTKNNTALYIGVTSDLPRRISDHKQRIADSHTRKYNIDKLVYAEAFDEITDAIHREKCLKRWKREWKIELIEKSNPAWDEILPW